MKKTFSASVLHSFDEDEHQFFDEDGKLSTDENFSSAVFSAGKPAQFGKYFSARELSHPLGW